MSTGLAHACAVKTDGTAVCWGRNSLGASKPPTGTYRSLSAGNDETVAIKTTTSLLHFGADSYLKTVPTGTFSSISTGDRIHGCGVRTTGAIACWGDDSHGQTSQAPTTGTFRAVTTGGYHSCAVRQNGTVTCWGRNDDGQTTVPTGLLVK